jgi:RCC1 and BTB domain-containing protein
MYTFGGGEHGQLGHGDKVNKVKPTAIEALEGIYVSQITCGWSHSVALTSNGRVYTWGNGDHGKLGHGSGKKVSTPQMVEKLKDHKVVRVASYNEHTATLVEPFDDSGNFPGAFGASSFPVTQSFLQDMRDLVDDDEYSDVTFLVDDQPIHAHRAILARRCDHFAAMFRSGMRESVEREIRIPNIPRPVFLLLMEYIYTDSVKIDLEHSVDLYIAADLYQLERLREMCCVVVRRNLTGDNAPFVLQNATDAHCQVLKEICMEYIVSNFDVISKSDGIKAVSHPLLLEILSLRP